MAKADKNTRKTMKKALSLEKKAMKYDKSITRGVGTLDIMDSMSAEGEKGLIDTKIFGFLRNYDIVNTIDSIKYDTGNRILDSLLLVVMIPTYFIADLICLPFTLTAGLIMNTLKFTGLFNLIRKRVKKSVNKVWDKKTKVEEKLYNLIDKNDLLDKEWFDKYGDVKIKDWDKSLSEYSPSISSSSLGDIAYLKQAQGNMEEFGKYKKLYDLARKNEQDSFFGRSTKAVEESKITEVKNETIEIETEKEKFDDIVKTCKESGMSDEDIESILAEKGYERIESIKLEDEKITESIEVNEDEEIL